MEYGDTNIAGAGLATPQTDPLEMTEADFEQYLDLARTGDQSIGDTASVDPMPAAEADAETESEAALDDSTEEQQGGEPPKAFRVFGTAEEYQRDFDEKFNRRYADYRMKSEAAKRFDELLPMLSELYGTDDPEAIRERLERDHAESMAERNGTTGDEYRKEFLRKRQTETERRELEELRRRVEAEKTVAEWRTQSAEVQKLHPDFDLDKAYGENKDFRSYLTRGLSVSDAYMLAYKEEILKKPTAPKPKRIPEGNMIPTGAAGRLGVEDMSAEEFEKYMRKFKE